MRVLLLFNSFFVNVCALLCFVFSFVSLLMHRVHLLFLLLTRGLLCCVLLSLLRHYSFSSLFVSLSLFPDRYATLFRIASGQMLGPDQPVHLHLIELPAAKQV